MSSFLENEAEESDDYDSDEVARHPRKKRPKRTEDSEEDEEDDEEALANEMKDLINDEEEEEEGESDEDEEGGQKRNRDEDESGADLDDDDLDLLEENLGVKLSRKKKFKRVRRLLDEESDDEGEKDERAAIANELFDDEEGGEQRPEGDRRRRTDEDENDRYRGISGSEESDDGDFIVDDNDEPINERRRRKKKGYRYNDEAMQQAQDVFGVDFDFEDVNNYGMDDEYEDEQDDEYEDEEEDDGEGGSRMRKKTKSRKASSRKPIFEVYEPAEVETNFLSERDKKITKTDLPERFQLREFPVTQADDAEIEEEADWIYLNAFSQPAITNQYYHAITDVSQNNEKQPIAGKKPPTAVPKIRETLRFIRNQNREVPFIQFYRKEYVQPELTNEDLWTIYKWDEKWCQLQQRKNRVKKLLLSIQKYQGEIIMSDPDAPLPEGTRIIGDADIERVDLVNSFDELKDCSVQLQLYYGALFPAMKQAKAEAAKKKRAEARLENGEDPDQLYEEEDLLKEGISSLKLAQRKDFYTVCQDAGILGMAERFGLNPEQFGENLRDSYQKHEVEQIPIEPEEFASGYVCDRFKNVEAVLNASKYMVARQIACDPTVRKVVRQVFFERAVVHVRPTKKGIKEIDENHPCFTFKYLRNKPIGEFSDDKFLHLVIGKQECNLTMRISMDKETPKGKDGGPSTYLEEIKALYQRDEFSSNVQKWNKLRYEALQIALEKFLYPAFEVELTAKVTKEAQEGVIKKSCRRLYDWLKVGPYIPGHEMTDEEEFYVHEGIRVLGFAYSSLDNPCFAVLVDADGEVTEHLRLPNFLLKRSGYSTDKEKELRANDVEKLKNFILEKKPHVICVGAKDITCKMLMEDLSALTQELSDEENVPKTPVEAVDDELAIVYMNSKRGKTEFHDFPDILRQAVSLARRIQDPLVEFSQLCTTDDEVLCMKYHPLQDHVPRDELLFNLQLEFIFRVNEVGVNINRILVHNYTSQLLQFVCGLGPRKAATLIRNLKKFSTPLLESRTQLLSNFGMGELVFQNCAGFIKIDTAQLADPMDEESTYTEVLDSTRIHPEAYDLARKMAIDALEYDDRDEPSFKALEKIMEEPENLKDLDLDAFAEQLAKEGCGNKKITLYDIREELNYPYRDLREIYRSPTQEEMFHLFTKESNDTFKVGKLVMGTVLNVSRRKPQPGQADENNPVRNDDGHWMCPVCKKSDFDELNEVWHHYDAELCPGQAIGVRVKLDNGLVGLVPIEKISDHEVINPDDRVKSGMTVHCRVIRINLENRYHIDLTCRTSDLNDKAYHWRDPKDLYYDFDTEDEDRKEEEDKKKKKAGKQNIFKRIIVHPSFHNIDYKQSEQMLESLPQGEAIFRPSSKGPDYLTLTWKVADGIYQHIAILEKNKDNAFSLGRQLIIEDEIFEDLDEIMARYITPMASFARDLTSFRHFKPHVMGNKREAEKVLLEEKKKRNTIVYILSASKEYPGKFLLSYPNKDGKVIHEWISIKLQGLKFRERVYLRLRDLMKVFQESWFKGGSTPLLSAPQLAHQQMTSPALGLRFPTPQQQRTPIMASPFHVGGVPSSAAAAAWNRASTSMPPPRSTPQRTPTNFMPPPSDSWAKIVQPGTPSHATPGASSQMSISPSYSPANKGDATPLLDECT